MKESMRYTCEHCLTEYKDKEMATKCENGHVLPKKIVRAKYQSIKNDASGKPCSIEVLMSDGSTATFKRY